MKSVLFIRHAKSSWGSIALKDFDRPLNERGHKDAPMMARRLLEKGVHIDLFVSSNALRAFSTATYFHEIYKAKKSHLLQVPSLYHAPVSAFYRLIEKLDDECKSVAIFSHNPGITQMVNSLGVANVDDMPTCGVFGVHIEIKSWADFQPSTKMFWLFDYPKLDS